MRSSRSCRLPIGRTTTTFPDRNTATCSAPCVAALAAPSVPFAVTETRRSQLRRYQAAPLSFGVHASTQVNTRIAESNSFPLDGGRLGWGWEGQLTLAPPPPAPPPTGGGGSFFPARHFDAYGIGPRGWGRPHGPRF